MKKQIIYLVKSLLFNRVITAAALTFNLGLGIFGLELGPSFAQNIGINNTGATPNASALLDVDGTNGGLLIPRMTTAQRDAINGGTFAQSLLIYNTTTKCLEYWENGMWQSMYCACTLPSAPTEAVHTPSATQIVWNWNTVAGATGYKWNTVNDYATATDKLTVLTHTETGLTCNTAYIRYVWAYNSCGNSTATTLTQTTASCCAGPGVITLSPNGPGFETNIPNLSGCAANWQCVDEIPSDENTTYISYPGSSNTWRRDLYAIPDPAPPSCNISNVTVYIRIRNNNSSTMASLRTYATTYDGPPVGFGVGWTTTSWANTLNPFTGLSWTWAEINALEIGLNMSDGNAINSPDWADCTQVYVEINYVP